MKRFTFGLLAATLLGGVFSFVGLHPHNPRCTAIAKSTGAQCKNYTWGECPVNHCYQHCR